MNVLWTFPDVLTYNTIKFSCFRFVPPQDINVCTTMQNTEERLVVKCPIIMLGTAAC
jgi:hypothetical protein